MARNYVQPGKTLTFTAPYQRNSGEGALIGAIFGVALQTVANAVAGEFAICGVWDITKTAAQTFTEGALVYWDNAAKSVTAVSTGNTRIGVAARAAAGGDATARVRLNGAGAPTGA
jgi:predicted RecA/RadA family phage recombinase